MDYTSSDAYATDAGTGQRLHQDTAAVTTAVSAQDANGLIWELLALIKAGGIAPAAFDKSNPATYTQVAQAIQSGKLFSAAAAGTADAITAVFTPDITVLRDGMALYVRGALANATTAPTFTPKAGTVAAKAIVKGAGAALAAGDIAGAGHWIELQYDLTLDKWVLLNPATGISAGSGQQAGEVCFFARNTAPSGFLKANGALVSRTTYATLFAAIGTTFGVGDGSTTFGLPDMRGEFLRAWDDARGVDVSRVFGSGQLDAMQGHLHSISNLVGSNSPNIGLGGGNNSPPGAFSTGSPTTDGTNGTPRVASENRPRNIALLACIKF
ncbi:tail fiber protein [Rhodoferax aquaticus]|uniref:Phage tail collar domain-containing protein n=1 Tax=Rhodoferax aquaticus TaxID=2527691 RepID=A0A515EKF3_9BURK|nr:tail fiber protein [Rhodoferax aquaticus]QDL53147.1 hypothetical protein EXZ61_02600 [Rhodoferax aquaticus]